MEFYFSVLDQKLANLYIFTEDLYKDLKNDQEFRTRSRKDKIKFYNDFAKSIGQLHHLGYFHNDIKPANLMITTKDYDLPKLIDFGMTVKVGKNWSAFIQLMKKIIN